MLVKEIHVSLTPQSLLQLADHPRVTVRRSGSPARGGKCVVYWMQRAQRAIDNPALDTAIDLGNALELPVLVFFSAISNFPHANLRHYRFMNQGFPDIEEDLAARNVTFVLRRAPNNSLEKFLAQVNAAMLVGDENPCREPERWRQVLSRRLSLPYWTVDADVVVPSNFFPKHQYALHIMKPKLYAEMPKYLVASPKTSAKHAWIRPRDFESFPVEEDVTRDWKNFDRSVPPVDNFVGGTHAAIKRMKEFTAQGLENYSSARNHPEIDGTSRLSPYLHFGHISPVTIVLAADAALKAGKVSQAARDVFVSELVGWREISVNFVKYVPEYDSIACAPAWAEKTLREHARDRRNPVYTLEELEQAKTYDDLWNAAQMQMTKYGWMHNYLRMYWAKKILEWSPDPARAYDHAVYLNDKYFLDGRDPNGYAGIAWAIAGVHDRPWFDRPIFGTVRYMSGTSTGKKFNAKRYIYNVKYGSWCGD